MALIAAPRVNKIKYLSQYVDVSLPHCEPLEGLLLAIFRDGRAIALYPQSGDPEAPHNYRFMVDADMTGLIGFHEGQILYGKDQRVIGRLMFNVVNDCHPLAATGYPAATCCDDLPACDPIVARPPSGVDMFGGGCGCL